MHDVRVYEINNYYLELLFFAGVKAEQFLMDEDLLRYIVYELRLLIMA